MKSIKVTIISNIILAPCFQAVLNGVLPLEETDVEILEIDYYEFISGHSGIPDKVEKTDYFVVCLNFDRLFPFVANDIISGQMSGKQYRDRGAKLCRELYALLKEKFQAVVLWFGFEDYFCKYPRIKGDGSVNSMTADWLNLLLYGMLKDGDAYLDLKRLIAEDGMENAYDHRGKYCWNAPYSASLAKKMCREIMRQHISRQGNGKMKKCIVLDCDNVLWGGVLTEDGMEGLLLDVVGKGQRYQEFQQLLLYLFYHGLLLAVSSKNALDEVLRVFREHNAMVLKEEHFACFQIGWGSKVDSIRKIAETLNIGVDSMVFVDDSLHEIREVQTELPLVETVWYGHDDLYEKLSCICPGDEDIEAAERRMEFYRKEQFRKAAMADVSSPMEYAAKLEMKTRIHEAQPVEYGRIAELSQRANRCTNGKRYTLVELKRRAEVPGYRVYSVAVSDKFSDLGIVGVMGTEGDVLDSFALSCRAYGRGLEEKMLDYVKSLGIKKFAFSETGKNNGLRHFLEASGVLCAEIEKNEHGK